MRVLTLFIVLYAGAALADSTVARFQGSANQKTSAFESRDAWMLEWSTQSDDALPKIFELRLYDADSGEFLGTVTQTRELGNGRKLFDESGRFQLDVVASNLNWTLTIRSVETSNAGVIKRRSEGQATIEDTAKQYARQVSEDDFASWRPVDDQTLLLFETDDSRGYRITFAHPCTGLSQATALMFVSAGYGSGGEIYEAIMLDDGTHCSFERVIPTVFD